VLIFAPFLVGFDVGASDAARLVRLARGHPPRNTAPSLAHPSLVNDRVVVQNDTASCR